MVVDSNCDFDGRGGVTGIGKRDNRRRYLDLREGRVGKTRESYVGKADRELPKISFQGSSEVDLGFVRSDRHTANLTVGAGAN